MPKFVNQGLTGPQLWKANKIEFLCYCVLQVFLPGAIRAIAVLICNPHFWNLDFCLFRTSALAGSGSGALSFHPSLLSSMAYSLPRGIADRNMCPRFAIEFDFGGSALCLTPGSAPRRCVASNVNVFVALPSSGRDCHWGVGGIHELGGWRWSL
jgi:hypothetical protein